MKNRKLRRLSGLFTMLVLLACLLTVSAFAGEHAEWGYQQLNTNQKAAYRALEVAVQNKAETVAIEQSWGFRIDHEEPLYQVLRMFTADHPEYYWFSRAASFSYISPSNVVTGISLEYKHETPAEKALFDGKVNEILAGLSESVTDYEKALYIHDALANCIVYDINYLSEQSAYSAIVERKAVCAGYARAYQYLLNQVGIDAWTVEGFGWNPQGVFESHAWNLVWIDNKCVYTDVTWDDQGTPVYAYFNRSLDDISKDHVTDSANAPDWVDYFGDNLPKQCDHDDETYFAMNGINRIPEVSIETLTTNVKGENGAYVIHVLLNETFDFEEFSAWFGDNTRLELIRAIGVNPYGSFSVGYSYMGDELRITIEPSSYTVPRPDLIGYIGEITAKGKLTAYANYADTDLTAAAKYDTVMVAYYSADDALEEVSFTEMRLDEHCRSKIEADCPSTFAYCRVFVVDSFANPAPLCDLLEMSAPATR